MRSRLFPVLVCMLVAGAGCRPASESGAPAEPAAERPPDAASGEVVATFGGRQLTRGQVLQEIERLPAPSRSYLNAPDRKQQFVDNMILNELLYDEGREAGLDRDPEIDKQVNELRRRLVIQRVMRKYQTPPAVEDEQAKKYYDENPLLYSTTQIRASHILVKDEATAKQLDADLKRDPKRFAEVAKEKSTDTTSAQKGGELGLFGPGRMVPDFERVAFSLEPGQVSDVVKTQYGYHIILVTERKEGPAKPFDQVKEQIKATLRNKGLQEQVQGHFDQLRQKANVQVNTEVLARITPPPQAPTAPTPGAAPMSPHASH